MKERINQLENVTIASVIGQMAAIETSLGALENTDDALNGYMKALAEADKVLRQSLEEISGRVEELENSGTDPAQVEDLLQIKQQLEEKLELYRLLIEGLQASDTALGQRIDELKTYVESLSTGDADRTWVSATFATLEQYYQTVAEIATIKESVKTLNNTVTEMDTRLQNAITTAVGTSAEQITQDYKDAISQARTQMEEAWQQNLSAAITLSESTLKTWVNTVLSGYCTIADTDAKIHVLETAIGNVQNEAKTRLDSLGTALNEAKSSLTSAYQEAIQAAIENNGGAIDAKVALAISEATASIQTQVQTIQADVANLQTRVLSLEGAVAQLIAMVQSMVVVPDYQDGSVLLRDEESPITFEVMPAGLAARLSAAGPEVFSLLAVYTQTTSHSFVQLPVLSVAADGDFLIVTTSGAALSEDVFSGDSPISGRLAVNDGITSYSTNYFPFKCSGTGVPRVIVEPEIVDLGLSVKWSSFNIGATSPEEFGYYYSWGEISPKTKYTWTTYKWCDGVQTVLTKYNSDNALGVVDNKTVLDNDDDVARSRLGSRWRMPSLAEFQELKNQCDWEWVSRGEVEGYQVTSRTNGKSIFLPAAGYRYSVTIYNAVPHGNYWTQNRGADSRMGQRFYFGSDLMGWDEIGKSYGNTIRPVFDESIEVASGTAVQPEAIDMGLSADWGSHNLGASKPSESGDFYSWGEVETKDYYNNWDNYKFTTDGNFFTKYVTNSDFGIVDDKTILDPEDDAAHVNLGGKWRMPTKEEVEDLMVNTDVEWTQENGVYGLRLTSKINGNSIFMPSTSEHYGYYNGYYWTANLSEDNKGACSWAVRNTYEYFVIRDYDIRCNGLCVRPVRDNPLFAISCETLRTDDIGITDATLYGKVVYRNAQGKNAKVSFYYSATETTPALIRQNGTKVNAGTAVSKETFHAAVTGLTEFTKYYYIAVATIDGREAMGDVLVFKTQRTDEYLPTGVDMGGDVLWASFNVGATQNSQNGYYLAWGETAPKASYLSDNYIYYDSGGNPTKYTGYDYRGVLERGDDPANEWIGGAWRLPTNGEAMDLYYNCSITDEVIEGVVGRLFTSHITGNSIFFPYGGRMIADEVQSFGTDGHYWTSTLRGSYYTYFTACAIWMRPSFDEYGYRDWGMLSRAVRSK